MQIFVYVHYKVKDLFIKLSLISFSTAQNFSISNNRPSNLGFFFFLFILVGLMGHAINLSIHKFHFLVV